MSFECPGYEFQGFFAADRTRSGFLWIFGMFSGYFGRLGVPLNVLIILRFC